MQFEKEQRVLVDGQHEGTTKEAFDTQIKPLGLVLVHTCGISCYVERYRITPTEPPVPDRSEVVQRIKNILSDTVSNLLYYDRKDDEDLPVGAIEEAFKKEWISIEDMVEIFKQELYSNMGD